MKKISCFNLCDIWERAIEDKNKLRDLIKQRNVERIYVGSYFCGNYFIHLNEKEISLFLSTFQREMKITLVVPTFNQLNLKIGKEKINKVMSELRTFMDEICINDFGMLQYCTDNFNFNGGIAIGRLLTKDYRDPRFQTYFKQKIKPKIFTSYFEGLCNQYKITGVEFDATHEYMDLSEAPKGICISLHTPFCYITMGSICEISSLTKETEKKFRPNDKCNFECAKHHIQYLSKDNLQFIKLGHAVYFENHITEIEGTDILRIIYFPLKDIGLFKVEDENK